MKFRRGLLVVMLTTASARAEWNNPDPIKWAWRCSSTGFYETKVLPEGRAQPIVDKDYGGPMVINVREVKDNSAYTYCSES
jgi:hypothetical protein